ncbi:carboxymuconolactone decarboxylase family protein [Massilia antarctica]|uniref:carboxymuconolactone decarboxylase family protein n=1 Tax=Massilia antarctica TaxID=2765360 RepID=UPI0006BB8485|nr:peroxidase-related enzyme [Massilia sp. H27-R4]MCY0910687.1 peroxidase-related enzyme [Massilia sp. H27-R4]CUI08940.1 Macrophage infectivity potentiator-related protein [Janthinobacterium sp. CG23_2]CUU32726.1 Macrophage infectivity potentiator-related protein [Janthinobacterium sp. CG23_2]
MSRITLLTRDQAPGDAAQLLDQVHAAFGATPNMFRAVANSPAALASMWAAFGALGGGTLGTRLGEQIAVAIADQNNCEYCLAAHTALGRKAGASSEEMTEAQAGTSHDPKTAAALAFAVTMVKQRAQVGSADVDALRQAGFNDGDIMEIMAHIALNLFTNYVNVAFAVPLDFPHVKLRDK